MQTEKADSISALENDGGISPSFGRPRGPQQGGPVGRTNTQDQAASVVDQIRANLVPSLKQTTISQAESAEFVARQEQERLARVTPREDARLACKEARNEIRAEVEKMRETVNQVEKTAQTQHYMDFLKTRHPEGIAAAKKQLLQDADRWRERERQHQENKPLLFGRDKWKQEGQQLEKDRQAHERRVAAIRDREANPEKNYHHYIASAEGEPARAEYIKKYIRDNHPEYEKTRQKIADREDQLMRIDRIKREIDRGKSLYIQKTDSLDKADIKRYSQTPERTSTVVEQIKKSQINEREQKQQKQRGGHDRGHGL